ncbi:MAG: ArnT family glycosyltransferase, partial [Candidatus Binatia bacterium]
GRFASPEEFIIAFAVDPSIFYLLGRWLSALLGTLTVGLTYGIGRRLYGRSVGLLGATLLAVNYLHVKDSHYITPDVPVAFMLMAAFWFAVRISEKPTIKNYAAAGILTGLAISVKYPAFVVAISLLTAHLIAVKMKANTVGIFSRKAWVAAALVPIAFLIGTPYSLLDWNNFLIDLWHQKAEVSRHLPIFDRAGILLFENPMLALGVSVYLCFLGGMVRCLLRRSWADILLLCFPTAYLAFLLVTGGLQHRYLVTVLPFFCLLAGLFLVDTIGTLTKRFTLSLVSAGTIMAVAIVALVFQPLSQSIALDLSLSQLDTRTQAKEWIERNISEGSRIAIESFGPPLLSAPRPVQNRKPNPTTEKWWKHRGKISGRLIYARLKSSRLGQEWKKYDVLIERERDNAQKGRPRYVTFKLKSIPYIWRVRLETGQVKEEEVKRDPGFRYFFEPEYFLSTNNIQYVVLSSSMPTSKSLKKILEGRADLVHRSETQPLVGLVGTLPFYSFHNPVLEIYRLRP